MSIVSVRVQKHRESLRQAGLRPVQIWVPDTRRAGFAEECRRQSRLASEMEKDDHATRQLMADSVDSVDGWTA